MFTHLPQDKVTVTMSLPKANLAALLEVQLNDIRDLLISGIYNVPFSVIVNGFPSAVLATSKKVRFAGAVPPPIPPMSVLQPDMKLKNVLSLITSHDSSESVRMSLYGTVKSKAEVVRYLLQVEGSILGVFSPAVRPA